MQFLAQIFVWYFDHSKILLTGVIDFVVRR